MGGDPSAYAALGLEPGADAAAIERAYKKLIKEHHPDREGGDSTRAAELNRAYRDLSGPRATEALEFNVHPDALPWRPGWMLAGAALAVGLLAGLVFGSPMEELWPASQAPLPVVQRPSTAAPDPMNQPLNFAAIDGAALEALRMSRFADEMALAAASRNCHHRLRTEPSVVQLDRCAAFDDAVVQLQDRDPLRDQGPFGELAVTGRLWSAASALSGDYLAIDGRLDRIRLRVELQLAAGRPA